MVSLLLGAFLVLLAAPAAYGQAAEGGAGGISREAQQPRAQPFSIPRVVPDRTQRAPEGAAAFNFPVTDFRVTGATILTESDLQALLEPFKSPESNFIRLQEAALAITNAYAKAGYSLSFAMVPEQAVRGGTVLIQVLEGYVDQVDVELQEGSHKLSDSKLQDLQKRLNRITRERPLSDRKLERILLTLDDFEGFEITTVLSPSEEIGAARLTAKVFYDSAIFYVDLNNTLRTDFGPYRGNAVAIGRSLLFLGDEVRALGGAASNPSGFFQFGGSYEVPIGPSGLSVQGSYVQTQTEALEDELSEIGFEGFEQVASLRVGYPIIRSRTQNLVASGSFFFIDSETELFDIDVVNDNLRYAQLGLAYDWAGVDGAVNLIELNALQGVPILGDTAEGQLLASDLDGDTDFTALRLRLFREQFFGKLRIAADVDGQLFLSGQGLSSVLCAYGGPQNGRGFDPGILAAENCIRGNIEASITAFSGGGFKISPFIYADGAYVRVEGALAPGEVRDDAAFSAGGGVRVATDIGISAEALLAVPLNSSFADSSRNPRFLFRVGLAF